VFFARKPRQRRTAAYGTGQNVGRRSENNRGVRARRQTVLTQTPETAPPELNCPTCGQPLIYRQTIIGGVTSTERWDFFECRAHGRFEYRDRTRRLRPALVMSSPEP
jgi:hypothetical protein